jgi:ABC-type multidrug transport system ATPase subunit
LLRGKIRPNSGQILLSGKRIEIGKLRKVFGFCPQDDILLGELTVRENVLHSARMKLPKSWTNRKVEQHVDSLMDALNLTNVAHSLVGGLENRTISGGQRKRTNIAVELASLPLILALDEPTSGLDATSALELTEILKKMTCLGMTIISIMHQPRIEIYKRIDDVLMLTPEGRVAYFGQTKDAKSYFEKMGYIVFNSFT